MKNILILIALFISFKTLSAQDGGLAGPSQPVILKYADSLVGGTSPEGPTRELIGNVQLTQGNVTVTCNRAIQYLTSNRVELIGNVKIEQGTMTILAPRVDYNGAANTSYASNGIKVIDRATTVTAAQGTYSTITHIVNFRQNVVVEDDSLKIWADALDYHRDTENSFAKGDVLLKPKKSRTYLEGDSIANIRQQNYISISGKPLLLQIDSVKNNNDDSFKNSFTYDTLIISADTMETYRGVKERYIAKGNVEMTRGVIASRSDSAIYEKSNELIRLLKTPILWMDSTQLSADTINVSIPQRRLKAIFARQNAVAVSRDDSVYTDRLNQLTGKNITINIGEDKVEHILSEGDAKSLYFLFSEEGADGMARNTADTIQVAFAEGKPGEIIWLGAVEGESFPEKIIAGKTNDYNLPEFRWSPDRPFKKSLRKIRITNP
ncbi:MAG: OstA-like protein [Bacteroidota bacterium]